MSTSLVPCKMTRQEESVAEFYISVSAYIKIKQFDYTYGELLNILFFLYISRTIAKIIFIII